MCDRQNCRYRHETVETKDQKDASANVAESVDVNEFAFAASDNNHSTRWRFDSGASSHMSNLESDFVSRLPTNKSIRGAFGSKVPAGYIGTAAIKLRDGDAQRRITFDDTLYSKDMKVRFLSVPALDKRKLVTIFFDSRVLVLQPDGTLVMTGSLKNKQYFLDAHVDNDLLKSCSGVVAQLFR